MTEKHKLGMAYWGEDERTYFPLMIYVNDGKITGSDINGADIDVNLHRAPEHDMTPVYKKEAVDSLIKELSQLEKYLLAKELRIRAQKTRSVINRFKTIVGTQ